MRSDGGKTTSSFLQSEFAPKDYFCGNDRLNGSFCSFYIYVLKIKKLRNCLKEARLNYTCERTYLSCVIFVLLSYKLWH